MQTINKAQTGDTVKGTSTSTSTSYTYNNHPYNAEQGWECPRCGRINAPWVRQCDCNRGWSITCDDITADDEQWKPYVKSHPTHDDWWKKSVDTFRIHPYDITWTGGSDYWDPNSNSYTNVNTTVTNTIHDGKLKHKEK